MGITVIEDLAAPAYRFTDPDAFLTCDNLQCDTPWLTAGGLVCWPIEETIPSASRFTERLVVACSRECLRLACAARRSRHRWSEPMPVGVWLEALRASLDVDPAATPIGVLVHGTAGPEAGSPPAGR